MILTRFGCEDCSRLIRSHSALPSFLSPSLLAPDEDVPRADLRRVVFRFSCQHIFFIFGFLLGG